MKKTYILRIFILFSFPLACLSLFIVVLGRYDAFPSEKRIAKNIELDAYGAQYQGGELDYCIPQVGMPVCSADFLENYPPGTQCFPQRCQWGHVTDISLGGARLRELPGGLYNLPHLLNLHLRDNQLTDIPPLIGSLRNLQQLDLSNNQLTTLPVEIGRLGNLTELNLSGNRITSLPAEIGRLGNLTELNLSGNHLTSLPAEISQLQHLTSLNISDNQFKSLPAEIGQLPNLKYLNVGGNPLSGPLPGFLTNAPLERFEFSKTELCVPTDEDFQKWVQGVSAHYFHSSPLYTLHDLCSLAKDDEAAMLSLYETPGRPEDWDKNTLPCLWLGVGCDSAGHIVTLAINNAKFDQLPPEIGMLVHLQSFRLFNTQLKELPPGFGNLRNLVYLEITDGKLTSLPPEIGQLRNLQHLALYNNQLTEIPPEVGLLANLRFLDVTDNPISGPLPMFLTDLPNLKFIFMNTNLCVPNDDKVLNWLRKQATGYYDAGSDPMVYVPADPERDIKWYLEYHGCK